MAGNEGEKFRVYKKYRFLSSTDGGAIQVVVLNNSIGILTLLYGRGGGRKSCRFVENHCLLVSLLRPLFHSESESDLFVWLYGGSDS